MNIYEKLSKNLKDLRIANSLTQKALSEKISVPRANIARYETSENVPSLEVLVKYADYFEVSIDELLGRKEY